ncbi:hypothetical protein EMGBS2_00450 [Actinomycetota bacterium]|nr:hypothetical protein EMGBS2_00450 [Actinomycetota bacterium]
MLPAPYERTLSSIKEGGQVNAFTFPSRSIAITPNLLNKLSEIIFFNIFSISELAPHKVDLYR